MHLSRGLLKRVTAGSLDSGRDCLDLEQHKLSWLATEFGPIPSQESLYSTYVFSRLYEVQLENFPAKIYFFS